MVKRFRKHLFLTFGIILVVVFVSGIFLGKYLEKAESDELSSFLRSSELSTESYLLEQSFIESAGEEGCELATLRINDLSNQLGTIGRRLSMEDIDKILGEKDFNFLKRRYHLMQLRTFLLYKQLVEKCKINQDIILFYYGSDNGTSQKQGKILDKLVEEYNIMVLALEYNYSKELNFMEYYYNISSTPSIVVNFNITLNGLKDEKTLYYYLNNGNFSD